MKKFICEVCGYIHVGEVAPDKCPICNVGPELFREIVEKKDAFVGFQEFLVYNKVKENDAVTSFYLKPVDNVELPTHIAGQFISIKPNIKGRENEVRQYSLSMKPGEDFYRISIKAETNVSKYMHENVNVNDKLEITRPLGEFVLKEGNEDRPLVLLSGGIGVTPMLSMLYKAAETGREIQFVQAVLNSTVHTFKDELKKIKDANSNVESAIFYQSPLETDVKGEDFDVEGFATKEWLEENLKKNAEYYFCGPLGFMKHIYKTLIGMGVSTDDINYELFGPHIDLSQE